MVDIIMPKMDGFMCLEKLHSHPEYSNIPVIVASNLGQNEDVDRALSLGAREYVIKSDLALDNLMEVIEGDDSHWSYLSASIFLREIHEFGAFWHGCSWSTNEIIDKHPSDYFQQAQGDSEENNPFTQADDWKWSKEEPKESEESELANLKKEVAELKAEKDAPKSHSVVELGANQAYKGYTQGEMEMAKKLLEMTPR